MMELGRQRRARNTRRAAWYAHVLGSKLLSFFDLLQELLNYIKNFPLTGSKDSQTTQFYTFLKGEHHLSFRTIGAFLNISVPLPILKAGGLYKLRSCIILFILRVKTIDMYSPDGQERS